MIRLTDSCQERRMPHMKNNRTWLLVAALIALSASIYGLQIWLFHDARTTEFYILQDLAFVPLSFAVTTIVVGKIMDEHERRDSIRKTRMLTSSFFTAIGAALLSELMEVTETDLQSSRLMAQTEKEVKEKQKQIETARIRVRIDEGHYNAIRDRILNWQPELLTLASNPLLLEQESFARLLWGILHLTDEFRLRGDYSGLNESDIRHFNEDFERVLRLLLQNGVANALFLKEAFPDFYGTAKGKAKEKLG